LINGCEADYLFFFEFLIIDGGSIADEEDCEEALKEVQEATERPEDLRQGLIPVV
jgi:hypothetical protein